MGGKCASCGHDATQWCSGCVNAPKYTAGEVSEPAYFCNHECQSEYWLVHKYSCQLKQKRKKLLRAGLFLKKAMIEYKRAFYYYGITSIDVREGQGDNDDETTLIIKHDPLRREHHRFPEEIYENTEQEEAVLLVSQCDAAMCLLRQMTEKLLEGIHESPLHVVPLTLPEKPHLRVEFDPPHSKDFGHYIIKARIKVDLRREDWAIDVSGAQFGFRDVLRPFGEYLADHGCTVKGKEKMQKMREPMRELRRGNKTSYNDDDEDGDGFNYRDIDESYYYHYDNGLADDINQKAWSWAKQQKQHKNRRGETMTVGGEMTRTFNFGLERKYRKQFAANVTSQVHKGWVGGCTDGEFEEKLEEFGEMVRSSLVTKGV